MSCSSGHPIMVQFVMEREEGHQVEIEFLEQGRGQQWSLASRLRTPLEDLKSASPELAHKLSEITKHLSGAQAIQYRRLQEQWGAAVAEIRNLKGLSRFLFPPSYTELQAAACHGSVIILVASRYSCSSPIVAPMSGDPHHGNMTRISDETSGVKEDLIVLLRTIWDVPSISSGRSTESAGCDELSFAYAAAGGTLRFAATDFVLHTRFIATKNDILHKMQLKLTRNPRVAYTSTTSGRFIAGGISVESFPRPRISRFRMFRLSALLNAGRGESSSEFAAAELKIDGTLTTHHVEETLRAEKELAPPFLPRALLLLFMHCLGGYADCRLHGGTDSSTDERCRKMMFQKRQAGDR
ncbi:uncharacterized protein BJ212DRAFT_1298707 [Suillus subaureus]|uniref:Uncharacterized protein n=1 Tax=Suillus subaureus TaxID=48587 RepID=A0A9P7JF21_9AGAM|nr:uncharacterized protein BJ212DRAFT_1298707 [Suillus subaureus]KAG1818642.1 hypothetical protein BJ212DRAFT_1298707 [Suillus subaureus]